MTGNEQINCLVSVMAHSPSIQVNSQLEDRFRDVHTCGSWSLAKCFLCQNAVAGYEHLSAQKTNVFQTVWKSNSVLLILNALREEWARFEAGVKTQQQLVVFETVQLFISLYCGIFLAWRLSFLQEDRKRIRSWKTNNIWPNLPEERTVQRVRSWMGPQQSRTVHKQTAGYYLWRIQTSAGKQITLFVRTYKRVPTAFRKKYPNKHINTSCLDYCVNAESAFTPLFFSVPSSFHVFFFVIKLRLHTLCD